MDWLQLFILAALGTGLSVAAQGFLFAYRNNIYHIPVVLKLFDSAQFASDPFYQSLRNFTSLVWPGLSLITTPANIGAVFLGAHLASRILLYVTCLVFLYQAGLRKTPQLAIAVLTLAFSRAFVDYSAVGATGMQIDYFTHTELTYPLILASLMLAANR